MTRRAPTPLAPFALVLAALLAPVASGAGQEAGGADEAGGPARSQATTAPADTAPPPVPQTFDWHRERGIPAGTPWGQAVDTAATRRILSWTTRPEYTTPLVDHLPVDGGTLSPSRHFGAPVGEPGVLHSVEEIHGYLRALAESSPRVRFGLLGETEEGNRLALVQVGSERNLERLDRVKAGMAALADPRVTSDSAAERLIADLPLVYTFYAGLHSTETGPPEMVMELAYRLAVSDDPVIRKIRDEVVVFIVPVVEPDGRDRVVQWHRRFNRDVYDPEDEVPGPPYWGHYIFHDNNRDGLQMSLALTRILVDLALEWHYPVGHDLHESVPFLYTSTGTGPYNPTLDPITIGEWQWFANEEVTALTAQGLPGVWTHGFYSGWYPGYLMWVTNNDLNGMGRFYETFGNSVPNTMEREVDDDETEVEWYRPNPPYEETLWSLRNNTNFMQSGALTSLSIAAENRERLLRNYWTKGVKALRKGRTEAPHAWVVPAGQPRRADAAYMLDLLRRHGIELYRATAAGTFAAGSDADAGGADGGGEADEADGAGGATGAPADSVRVREGDYVLRMDQPYRNYLLTLMQRQRFPEDAPSPYDDVAWTFPLMSNVEARSVADSSVLALPMEPVEDAPVRLPGRLAGDRDADWVAVSHHAQGQAVRAWLAVGPDALHAAEEPFRADGRDLPAGTWLVRGEDLPAETRTRLVEELGLDLTGVDADELEGVERHALDPPRLALLHTWDDTQDDGSVRYALDVMGVPYEYIAADDLAGADLRSRFDVILMATQGARATGRSIFEGIDPKWSPLPYTRTPEHPTHGTPDSSPDITGGMGYEGLVALRDFVEGGGTFLALGTAGRLATDMGLVRGVSAAEPEGLFVPGSLVLGAAARPDHPLLYGYGERFPLYHRFGPYWDVDDDLEDAVVVEYAAEADSLLLSGLARQPAAMAGEPAVVVVPRGRGTVVLYGFDPLHRFQPHGDFALVWNALMSWNDLRESPAEPEA